MCIWCSQASSSICNLLLILAFLSSSLSSISSFGMMDDVSYHIRPYDPKDLESILEIFKANLLEEWTKYHNGQYLPNAQKYVEECLSEKGDLRNIDQVYSDKGGFFWVLVRKEQGREEEDTVVGTVGMEKISDSVCELRRMCLISTLRRQGWGTKLGKSFQQTVKESGFQKVICSTPEHGEDVLQFYHKLGFVDTNKRSKIHNSPINEVFLEWNVA